MGAELLLGLGGTVDYEITWDAAVLESLARTYGITAAQLDPSIPVVDERSLVVSALALLRDGRGGERFVSSTHVLEEFAARFDTVVTLGGTCVRAALAMARLGIPSTVHLVSIDDTVRRLLPAEVSFVCSASADSTDPHVIVQYPAGARVGLADAELVAPHPNRLIYVNDLPNRELLLSPELPGLVAHAQVFLASGFNTIQDAAILDDRLDRVTRAIAGRPEGAIAIFEDAGSHDPAHGVRVRDALARSVDVYGLNEDELFGYVGGPFDLLDPAAVESALARAAELIPAPLVVVHTKHWAAAFGADAERWRAALDGGVTMAGTRFRVGDSLTPEEYARTTRLPRQPPAVGFATELESRLRGRIAVVPAYALDTASPTTIGLGDSFVGGFIAALARAVPDPGLSPAVGSGCQPSVNLVVLPSNRPADRFYRGGRRITDFRGVAPAAEFEPEDWVGSVTAVRGEAPSGQTVLPDGTLLADAIAADPVAWLGDEHVAAFGADPMLLVKLLDAGQRLPVHAHPDGPWAAEHLAAAHGKTEAWYVLTAGDVHLGLARDLDRRELRGIVAQQDTETLLASMHRIEVDRGDVVYVPTGVLHAIGEGILLVELQEPADLSILVEWRGFAIDGSAEGHLGLGFDVALDAVETTTRSPSGIEGLVQRADTDARLLPPEADEFFRLERVRVDGRTDLAPGFAIIVVLAGDVTVTPLAAPLSRGTTVLLPYAAGAVSLEGSADVLVCRPPLPR